MKMCAMKYSYLTGLPWIYVSCMIFRETAVQLSWCCICSPSYAAIHSYCWLLLLMAIPCSPRFCRVLALLTSPSSLLQYRDSWQLLRFLLARSGTLRDMSQAFLIKTAAATYRVVYVVCSSIVSLFYTRRQTYTLQIRNKRYWRTAYHCATLI